MQRQQSNLRRKFELVRQYAANNGILRVLLLHKKMLYKINKGAQVHKMPLRALPFVPALYYAVDKTFPRRYNLSVK